MNGDIGDGKKRSVDPGGQTDAGDLFQRRYIYFHLFPGKSGGIFHPHKGAHYQHCGDHVGNLGGDPHAQNVHLADDHKKEIEEYIDDSGNGNIDQRPFGIAGCTHDRGTESVKDHRRDPQTANPHIKHRIIKNFCGGGHDPEHRFGENYADHRHSDPPVQGNRHRRVDDLREFPVILGADIACRQNVHPGAQTVKNIEDKHSKSVGRSYCCHRFGGTETPQYDQVGSIKKQPQYIGKDQRDGKTDNLGKERSVTHIYLVFAGSSHNNAFLKKNLLLKYTVKQIFAILFVFFGIFFRKNSLYPAAALKKSSGRLY